MPVTDWIQMIVISANGPANTPRMIKSKKLKSHGAHEAKTHIVRSVRISMSILTSTEASSARTCSA